MQRKKRTKSKLVKQFMNFLLAIALGISLLQLPQLSKEVKAENVNTNNGKLICINSISDSILG